MSILPAVSSAARARRPFVVAWLCRGAGSPLELITNAGLPAGGASPAAQAQAEAATGSPTQAPAHTQAPDRTQVPDRTQLPAHTQGRDRTQERVREQGAAGVQAALLFPPGARGEQVDGEWLAWLSRLVWAPCPGHQAPVITASAAEAEREDHQPTMFESALTALLGRPFGWLVVAQPTERIGTEMAELRTAVNVHRRHDEERSRFEAERAQRRLAELDAFGGAGMWQVRVLAGAATPADLAALGPMLTGSLDLAQHPYRLACGRVAVSLADALTATDSSGEAEVPIRATAGVVAALAGLPRLEVPGLRVVDAGNFDLTSELGDRASAGPGAPAVISLGMILDSLDRPVGGFHLPLETLNRHAFVTGATGAGKSQTVRHLLEQLHGAGVPWLVIEPVKSEYAGMAGRLSGGAGPGGVSVANVAGPGTVTVINPADPQAIPISVNPLAPEPGYPVQSHIDMVRALFLAAFEAEEPFPQIMAQALQQVYQVNGWDVVTGGRAPGAAAPPAVPTLAQLQRAAIAVIEDVGYGRDLQADVRGFVDVRLRSLRIGSAGRFFEGGQPADIAGLLRRNVVLAFEDVANDEDKAFLMGTLIIRIVEHLRMASRAGMAPGLRHVIVIEEAHRLLRARREGRATAHAVELFAGLLAEIRAYGEGLVIAEQIPSKLIGDVVKNTSLKIVHRLPARDDRDLVGAAMNLDEAQSRQVVSLAPGVAAVFADGMDRPVRVAVPFGGSREHALPGPPPPMRGRRSVACGAACVTERACTLAEVRGADLLAEPGSPEQAWLRLWTETLVLALLTGRGLPAVPRPLRHAWRNLAGRLGQCLLATVVERVTGARARAVRASYDPVRLTESAARVALELLDHGRGAGTRTGATWVVGQVRWLHEMERVCPLAGDPPAAGEQAPPLEFGLPGLTGWPGMRVGHRMRALRRHPLSMALAHNRWVAWTVLLGDDDQRAFTDDLAVASVGLEPGAQLDAVAGEMGVAGWLEVVLSWPRRFVVSAEQGLAGPHEFDDLPGSG